MLLTSRDQHRLAREFRLTEDVVALHAAWLESGLADQDVAKGLGSEQHLPAPVAGRFPDAVRYALRYPTSEEGLMGPPCGDCGEASAGERVGACRATLPTERDALALAAGRMSPAGRERARA